MGEKIELPAGLPELTQICFIYEKERSQEKMAEKDERRDLEKRRQARQE